MTEAVATYLTGNFVKDDKGTALTKLKEDLAAQFPDGTFEKADLDTLVSSNFGDDAIRRDISAARRYKIAKGKGDSTEPTEEKTDLPEESPAMASGQSVIDLVGRLQKQYAIAKAKRSGKTLKEQLEDENACSNLSFALNIGNNKLLPTSYVCQLMPSPIQIVEDPGAFMYMEFPLVQDVTDEAVTALIDIVNKLANFVIPMMLGDILPEIQEDDSGIKELITSTKLFKVGEIDRDYLLSFCLERPEDKPSVLRATWNLGISSPLPFIMEKIGLDVDVDMDTLICRDTTEADLRDLFKSFDTDNDDMIDMKEFETAITRLGAQMNRTPADLFKLWDTDNDGFISQTEFITAVRPIYESITDLVTDPESGIKAKAAFRSDVDLNRLMDTSYDPFDPSIQMSLNLAFGKKFSDGLDAFIKKKSKKWKRGRDMEKLFTMKVARAAYGFFNKGRIELTFGGLKDFVGPLGKTYSSMMEQERSRYGGSGNKDMEEILQDAFCGLDYGLIVRAMQAGRAFVTKEAFVENADESCIAWAGYNAVVNCIEMMSEFHAQVGQIGMNHTMTGFSLLQHMPRLTPATEGNMDALIEEAFKTADRDQDGVLKFEDCKNFVNCDIEDPFKQEEFKFESYRQLCADWEADPEQGVSLEKFSKQAKDNGFESVVEMYNTIMLWEGKVAVTNYEQRCGAMDQLLQAQGEDRERYLTRANEAMTAIVGAVASQVVEVEDEGYSS